MGDGVKTTEGTAFIESFAAQVVAKHGLSETRYSVVQQWLEINESTMRVELKALLKGKNGELTAVINDCVYEADASDDDKVAHILEMTGIDVDDEEAFEELLEKMKAGGMIAVDYIPEFTDEKSAAG